MLRLRPATSVSRMFKSDGHARWAAPQPRSKRSEHAGEGSYGLRAFGLRALIPALALAAGGLLSGTASADTLPASSPFDGTALWIAKVPVQQGSSQLASQVRGAGVHTLYVKGADGSTPDPQLTAGLVSTLRTDGVPVCAWTFAYGQDPVGEANAAVAAVRSGAQCLVVDAEGQYDGRYGAAQIFVRSLRAQLGARFPIALAGQAEILQHPTFPYSVFLGPGGFNFDLPQIYWLDLNLSVTTAYAATIGANSVYARPVLPVGQLYGAPSPSEVTRFRALASAYGLAGMSFFDLESAQRGQIASLAVQPPRLSRKPSSAPTLRAGADGDEIVWAQELLNDGHAGLPVGGFYGARTARAVAHFQLRHHLRANGVLGPATWKALLHLKAREPSWATSAPQSARPVHPGA